MQILKETRMKKIESGHQNGLRYETSEVEFYSLGGGETMEKRVAENGRRLGIWRTSFQGGCGP